MNGARCRARHFLSNDRGTLADSNFAYNLFYDLCLSHKSKLHNDTEIGTLVDESCRKGSPSVINSDDKK